jgi:tetrahydromethanopterin S-methyltransferase subunit F
MKKSIKKVKRTLESIKYSKQFRKQIEYVF